MDTALRSRLTLELEAQVGILGISDPEVAGFLG